MKKFYDEKELAKHLNTNLQYVNDEISNYLGCQGSETFKNENDISIDAFKYEGFKINDTMVYIATIPVDEDEYKYVFCIE